MSESAMWIIPEAPVPGDVKVAQGRKAKGGLRIGALVPVVRRCTFPTFGSRRSGSRVHIRTPDTKSSNRREASKIQVIARPSPVGAAQKAPPRAWRSSRC